MNQNHKPVYVKNSHGDQLEYAATVHHMDNDLREAVHDDLAPCTEQEFFDEYAKRHEQSFGEPWFLTNRNPIW